MLGNIENYQDNDMIQANHEFLKFVRDDWYLNT